MARVDGGLGWKVAGRIRTLSLLVAHEVSKFTRRGAATTYVFTAYFKWAIWVTREGSLHRNSRTDDRRKLNVKYCCNTISVVGLKEPPESFVKRLSKSMFDIDLDNMDLRDWVWAEDENRRFYDVDDVFLPDMTSSEPLDNFEAIRWEESCLRGKIHERVELIPDAAVKFHNRRIQRIGRT
jgi:hypothetical protein